MWRGSEVILTIAFQQESEDTLLLKVWDEFKQISNLGTLQKIQKKNNNNIIQTVLVWFHSFIQ